MQIKTIKYYAKILFPPLNNRIGRITTIKLKLLWNFIFVLISFPLVYYSIISIAATDSDNLISLNAILPFLFCILALICAINSIRITIARLHDINLSGWLILIALVPIIGTIASFIMIFIIPGTKGINRFGEQNKKATNEDFLYIIIILISLSYTLNTYKNYGDNIIDNIMKLDEDNAIRKFYNNNFSDPNENNEDNFLKNFNIFNYNFTAKNNTKLEDSIKVKNNRNNTQNNAQKKDNNDGNNDDDNDGDNKNTYNNTYNNTEEDNYII